MSLIASLKPIAPDPAWDRLFAEAAEPNPFFGPGFLLAYCKNVLPGRLKLAVVEDSATGKWLMAAPVGRKKAGFAVPIATLWASEYGPVGAPLMHPECPAEAVAPFLEAAASIAALPMAATLQIQFLPLHGPTNALLTSNPGAWTLAEDGEMNRAAHASGTAGEGQLAKACQGKRRKEFDRLARRLAELGTVSETSARGADAAAAFDEFMTLEAKGWKGELGTALGANSQTRAFAAGFIRAMAAQDALRIDALRLDGRAIAMLVLVEHAGRSHAWKIAYDEDLARFSPGQRVTLMALQRNLGDDRLDKGGDSLAVPHHPMINTLWRGSLHYTTLRARRGLLSGLVIRLQRLDHFAHLTARRIYHRLRSR